MNKVYQYIALAVVALSFAACTQEDGFIPQGYQKDTPLAIASAGVVELTTRATINNDNLEGGSIGVFVTSTTDNDRYKGDNIKWTYNNGEWGLEDATVVFFENNGEKQQIAAYYPYNENLGTGNVYSITLPEAYDANYEDFDYLYGQSAPLSSNPATITMNHLMAKVTVTVNTPMGTEIAEGDAVKTISLMNVPRTADWTLPGATLTNHGTNANTALYAVGSTYNGYALPDGNATSLALRIEMNSKRIFTATVSLGAALASGKHYTIGLKVGKDKAEISSVIVQPWGDGATIEGGVAKEVLPSIDGTTYTSVTDLQNAVKDKLSQEGATSVTIDGNLNNATHEAVISAISEVKTEGAVTNGDLMAGSVTYTVHSNFADAVAGWTDDGMTLTMLGNATNLTEAIKTTAKGLTLDLNGCTIVSTAARTIWVDAASELTIRDSKDSGQIKGLVFVGYSSSGGCGTLLLESGTLESVSVSGIFTMTGGTIKNEAGNGSALLVDNRPDTVLITGGEICGSNYGVFISSGNVIVTGTAKVSGGTGIFFIVDDVPTITGGTFSHDPSDYVDTEKYDVTESEGVWTVTAKE